MNRQYNHRDDVVSFLEFGAIRSHPPMKKVYDFRSKQQAYDWFMHARYSNDLICYSWMLEAMRKGRFDEAGRLYREMIHHKHDFSCHLAKWAALQISDDSPAVFYEHGQTLFGCIEGVEVCDFLLRAAGCHLPRPDLKAMDVTWVGYDISKFFNALALRLHQGYTVRTCQDLVDIPEVTTTSFAKGVTLLYALRAPKDFFDIFGRAACGIFDISFSVEEKNDTYIGTGKQVCYLPVRKFLEYYNSSGRFIYVRKNACGLKEEGSRVYLEGVICNDGKTAEKYARVDADFKSSLNDAFPELSACLVHANDRACGQWRELSSYAAEHLSC